MWNIFTWTTRLINEIEFIIELKTSWHAKELFSKITWKKLDIANLVSLLNANTDSLSKGMFHQM